MVRESCEMVKFSVTTSRPAINSQMKCQLHNLYRLLHFYVVECHYWYYNLTIFWIIQLLASLTCPFKNVLKTSTAQFMIKSKKLSSSYMYFSYQPLCVISHNHKSDLFLLPCNLKMALLVLMKTISFLKVFNLFLYDFVQLSFTFQNQCKQTNPCHLPPEMYQDVVNLLLELSACFKGGLFLLHNFTIPRF